jgi:hypothetical protein
MQTVRCWFLPLRHHRHMTIRQRSPEFVAAQLREIKRRYERQAKVGRRTRSMAAIRIAELSRWLSDQIGSGAELEPSQWSEGIVRIFVHHFVVLSDGNRRASEWMHDYCPWISARSRESMISEANHCPLKYSADTLAWKIRLTDAKRSELKITTIGAIDVGREQRAERRRKRHAELARIRRATIKANRVTTI